MILSYSHQTARNIWPYEAHWNNLNPDNNSDYTVEDLMCLLKEFHIKGGNGGPTFDEEARSSI
jgi:hypothetical protein